VAGEVQSDEQVEVDLLVLGNPVLEEIARACVVVQEGVDAREVLEVGVGGQEQKGVFGIPFLGQDARRFQQCGDAGGVLASWYRRSAASPWA